MMAIWGPIAGAFIVLMMLAFVALWIWAWLPRHKRDFAQLAQLPMQDEDVDSDASPGGRP